ncbi:hypothetical protein DACRYDRAFT_114215 [Dacryopinax primogenitus]|uniref:Uncharacterized protein n=1 Tax=Dacryopinax primogenitus (strain DJM 731) TaxID=1858805 RepID=M5GG54_DACPD|nr:uncharacterized protein DACRYDRAFT_114215 [Dacryopinax primogenitus]EJU04893.1 hypothetical protein DACRYDRAFT_114215 [Dacryopinax primogenitus]
MAAPATPAPLHPPSPPSHTPAVDFTLIERQKENIQPLRNGRSASALQSVFSAPRQDRAAALQVGREKHEEAISAVEGAEAADGYDDPLEPYVQFVKWTIDNYPAGQTADSGVIPLLERTARRFKDDPRYKSDLRYLKVWVTYAGYVHDAKVIYQHLLANEIGTCYALLYEEYAGVLEKASSRDKAHEIFQLGIARKAQPLNRLPSRFAEFQKRMLLAPADPVPVAVDPTTTNGASAGRRQVLAPRSLTAGAPLASNGPPTNQGVKGNRSLAVFVDEENMDPSHESNAWPDVGTKASRVKENTQASGPWKGEKLKMRGPAIAGHGATPARKVDVYQDEEVVPKTPSHPPPEDVFSRSLKPSEDQLLRQDPFKNFSPTPSPAARPALFTSISQPKARVDSRPTQPVSEGSHTFRETRNPNKPFVPQQATRKLVPGVSKSGKGEAIRIDLLQMYKDGVEWSLDEMRARRRGMLGKTWEDEPISTISDSKDDILEPLKDDPESAPKEAERERMTMRLDAPTVNTRAALDDVYGLFNTSPAKSEQEEPPSPAPVTRTPSLPSQLPRLNENATARKPSGPFSAARTPLTAFNALTAVMATPTPAQGSLGRSASGRSLLELHAEEPQPEPVKTPRRPLDIFTDAPAPNHRSAVKRTPFEIFVDENSAAPKTPASATPGNTHIVPKSDIKPFTIFVDPEVDASDNQAPLKSDSPAAQDVNTTTQPLVENEPVIGGASEGQPRTPPTVPGQLRLDDIVEKPKMFSFIDEADSKNVVSQEPHTPKPAFVPFIDSPEQVPHSSSTVQSRSTAKAPNAGLSMPLRPDLSQLRTVVAALDVEEQEPQTPWSEEDEERWVAEQDRQARRNARLGNFNIMTPITERTCEFTQMGSVVGQDDEPDDDDEDRRSPSVSGQPNTAQWSEYVTAEEKVVGEFELSIADKEASMQQIPEQVVQVAAAPEDMAAQKLGFPPNPCNPFDGAIQTLLFSRLPPLDATEGFHDLRNSEADKLNGLQKYAKKMARKSGNTTTVLAEDRYTISLGNDLYDVKEKLGEGGFGSVFLAQIERADIEDDEDADLLEDDEDEHLVAVKAERPCNIWEAVVLQRILSALPERLRASVIRPKSLYAYHDESYLILDFCQQGTLLDAVNQSSMANSGTSNVPGMDELLAMFFCIELMRLVEALHTTGFIHGDMKIDNCLVRLDEVPGGASSWSSSYSRSGNGGWSHKGIRMIDFGRSIDISAFPAGQEFIGDWPTDERDCVELRENRPWTYQIDYFGLASIVYCMLFGKYIETVEAPKEDDSTQKRYKIANSLKRYWQCDLWNRLFELLLNPCLVHEDGMLPVTRELAAIREDMETWLEANSDKAGKSLKGMLKKVELAALGKKRRY